MGVCEALKLRLCLTDSTEPPLGTRLLPEWLRSPANGRQMVSLKTFNGNLCLWRCSAIDQGALLHQGTQAARELAKSYFNMRTAPLNVAETWFD